MQSRLAKPLFGLIVLLAWLGLGSSARAGFVLGQRVSFAEPGALGADFALSVTLDGDDMESSGASPVETGKDDGSRDEEAPWSAPLPPSPLAWPGPQTNSGTGGTSSSAPTSGGGGSVLAGILAPKCPPPSADGANRLLVGDERFTPPPFASRLFRPPR